MGSIGTGIATLETVVTVFLSSIKEIPDEIK